MIKNYTEHTNHLMGFNTVLLRPQPRYNWNTHYLER